jgi:hypothetical protein
MVFNQGPGYTTTSPAILIQKGTELQIGRTKAKVLHHPESPVENFPGVDGRTVRNTPIIIEALDRLTHTSWTQLIGGLRDPYGFAVDEAMFARGQDPIPVRPYSCEAL